jgi:hypothetical protein
MAILLGIIAVLCQENDTNYGRVSTSETLQSGTVQRLPLSGHIRHSYTNLKSWDGDRPVTNPLPAQAGLHRYNDRGCK